MNRLEEILIILSEESAEVSQAAIKCVRFGMDSISFLNPDGPSNKERLETELGDLLAMFKLLIEEHGLSEENVMKAAEAKLVKVEKFMKNTTPLDAAELAAVFSRNKLAPLPPFDDLRPKPQGSGGKRKPIRRK